MTDIVTRLRTWVHAVDAVPASDLMDEAAAEIERLRADWPEQLKAARSEIERLRNGALDAREAVQCPRSGDCPDADNAARQDIAALADDTPAAHATPGEGSEQDGCTLTDAERRAVAYYIGTGGPDAVDATLWGLLERMR